MAKHTKVVCYICGDAVKFVGDPEILGLTGHKCDNCDRKIKSMAVNLVDMAETILVLTNKINQLEAKMTDHTFDNIHISSEVNY